MHAKKCFFLPHGVVTDSVTSLPKLADRERNGKEIIDYDVLRAIATVLWSVCVLDTTASFAKTTEPRPRCCFGLWAHVGTRNLVLRKRALLRTDDDPLFIEN